MFKEEYKKEMSGWKLTKEQKERIVLLMTQTPVRRARRAGRLVLAAAVFMVLCICSVAAAYALGAFDFLRKQSEYAMLGQTEVYEEYAYEVKRSVTAENGDILTVDRAAMDGKFCMIFYSVHFADPVVSMEELKQMQEDDEPDLWQLWKIRSLNFTLNAGEEEISLESYDNSFEPMEYLADTNTIYGAWRILLSRAVEEEEQVTLGAELWDPKTPSENSRSTKLWELSVDFAARPIQGEHFEPDVAFPVLMQGETVEAQVVSLDRSPLGTQLTLRVERLANMGLSLELAMRDADTGNYIPHAEIVTSHYSDPDGCYDMVYELYGDVSELKNLELIPVWWTSSMSQQQTVSLNELPYTDPDNSAGGYAPASYAVGDGQIIVTMQPVGPVTDYYARIGNGVYFQDEEGNDLFSNMSIQKFKNRSDGAITVVMTPDAISFQEDINKVAKIWFHTHPCKLMEDWKVSVPLAGTGATA